MTTISKLLLAGLIGLAGCSDAVKEQPGNPTAGSHSGALAVKGRWIFESNGQIMADPQPSGLSNLGGQLVTISDGSAQQTQQRRIHVINPLTAQLLPQGNEISMANRVRRSCFADYLSGQPDLEALVVDPEDPTVLYTVTEDATRTGALSVRCQQQFENTGSTDYPTLLVRIKRSENGDSNMTHVRALQFPLALEVGDFPNDGIEGMALADDRTLYLALEKDKAGSARILSIKLDENFWSSDDFAVVQDAQLKLPEFRGGNHPINGLEYYLPEGFESGFLLAAARNDNELWVIDTAAQQPTKRIAMYFTAPTGMSGEMCEPEEVMDNASIEGVAVIEDTLWLINDPWKKNYAKNIQCPANRAHYESMAPLLFSTPLQQDWFTHE